MSAITLETIQAKQSELATLIAQFQAQPVNANRQIEVKGQTITLHPGEYYAGAVLDADGHHLHHLVLMAATPGKRLEWQEAMDWAAETGGALPNRQEQALLLANCKPHLKAEWHWSCESNEEDASYAWGCFFSHGNQDSTRKSGEGCAVAVRRL